MTHKRSSLRFLPVALVFCAVSPADAQVAVYAAYEGARDRFAYRFENPSSFQDGELVPHYFVQTYWADNHWLLTGVQWHIGGRSLRSEFAMTPQRTTRGDDFDTFLPPSGDVAVFGTTGNVSLRSWRVRQTISLARAAGLLWHIGYVYRRDRSVFHLGQKIVTHTMPPSREESITTDRETTTSSVHEVLVGVQREWSISPLWRASIAIEGAPTTNAALTTILPDKYPGREILFNAIVATVSPTFTVTRAGRWPLSLSVSGSQTFSYVDSRQFDRTILAASARMDFPF